jgi:hypothetical protein
MLKTKILNASSSKGTFVPVFENLAKEAVAKAIARQKALGLPNYFTKNGRIYGRAPNGQFVSTK